MALTEASFAVKRSGAGQRSALAGAKRMSPGKEDVGSAGQGSAPGPARAGLELSGSVPRLRRVKRQAVGSNQTRLSGEYNLPLSSTLRGDAQEPGKEDVGRADPGSAPSPAWAGLE